MSFVPIPCPPGGGEAGADVENLLLCDVGPDGEVLGTALAVYEYDADGNPAGPPTFVDPATGDPYVAQGTLQPCPGDVGCLNPIQFCFTSSSTGPVDHPGRQYDITLPINPGFAVESLQVDAITHAANLVWDVNDPDGENFRADLTAFMEARLPADAVVTITNPNAGGGQICESAQPMQIHIECLRLDQAPPNLVELVYNGGQDLIQNPAYNEDPPLDPPVSQGNYGFHLLSREDDPGPFPFNQPAEDAECTSVANRGWETNDVGRTFEIWGADQVSGQSVTPTPRGTPVQEMTSDGPPPGGVSTIWQTFNVPVAGTFRIRVVHGARDPGETHRITLSTGDDDDNQTGNLINDVTVPASVTISGGPNPWTQFSQDIPLNPGLHTLALSSTNPVLQNRGGLFTDMRAFLDLPGQRATASVDDDTCIVTVDETVTTTNCEFWQPRCINGEIVSWRNVEDQEELLNGDFWAQVPSPECCVFPPSEAGEGGSSVANLVYNHDVCGIVGGVPTTLNRVVITDASGGVIAESFIGPNGAPVTPASWTNGECEGSVAEFVLCDVFEIVDGNFSVTSFIRKFFQNSSGIVTNVIDFTMDGDFRGPPNGEVTDCGRAGAREVEQEVLCDDNGPFVRVYQYQILVPGSPNFQVFQDYDLDGNDYTPVGTVGNCPQEAPDTEFVCFSDNTGTRFFRSYVFTDATGVPTIIGDFDENGAPFAPVLPVFACDSIVPVDSEQEILCDATGARFVRRYSWDGFNAVGNPLGVTDWTLDGAPFVPVLPVGACPESVPDRERICYTLTSTGDEVHVGWARHDDSIPNTPQTPNGIAFFDALGNFIDPTADGFTQVICDSHHHDAFEVLCDATGASFIRLFTYNDDGVVTDSFDIDFDGDPFVPEEPVGTCESIEVEDVVLCDDNGPFIRSFVYNTRNANFVNTIDRTLAGSPYVPVGDVGVCPEPCCPTPICYDVPTEPADCGGPSTFTQDTNTSTFDSHNIVANPMGWNITTIERAYDGIQAQGWNAWVNHVGTFVGDTQIEIDFILSTPRDRVTLFRLWNNYGSIRNDADGIGVATITVFDSANNVLFTGPLNAGNGAAPFDTPFPSPLDDVARVRLGHLQRIIPPNASTGIGVQEIALLSTYQATIEWECDGDTITALVEGANAGITVVGNQITQTNGPHTLTFSGPPGFQADIITDTPAAFSTLTVTNGTVVTLAGNATVTMELTETGRASGLLHAGFVCLDDCEDSTPVVRDAQTGEIVANAIIVPCLGAADPAENGDFEFQVLCDDSGPFLRRFFATNNTENPLVTDTALDGVTPYAPVGQVRVCTPDEPTPVTVAEFILCDNNGQFIRKYIQGEDGVVNNVVDFDLGGAAYTVVGPVVVCPTASADRERICYTLTSTGTEVNVGWARHDDSIPNTPQTPNGIAFFDALGNFIDPTADGFTQVICANSSSVILSDICYAGPALEIFQSNLGGALPGGIGTAPKVLANFAGSGVDVTVDMTPGSLGSEPNRIYTGTNNGTVITITFSQAVQLRRLRVRDLDNFGVSTNENYSNWSTQPSGVAGDVAFNTPPPAAVVVGTADNTAGDILWANDSVTTLSFNKNGTNGLGQWLEELEFQLGDGEIRRATAVMCDGCETPGEVRYFDSVTGDEVINPTIVSCPCTDCVQHVTVDNFPTNTVGEFILCDDNGPFIRKYIQNENGEVLNTVNLTLAGVAYTTVGDVVLCGDTTTSTQHSTVLCDDNGPFVRIFTVDAEGVILDIDNMDLDGIIYVPVGNVDTCTDCCPINIGEGCTNVGSGTYVSIRNGDGTISLVDPVTGAFVLEANIIDCPAQPVTFVAAQNALDSTIQRQTGAGNIVIAAGARSITLTVLTGVANVTIAADPVVAVPAGVSLTWAVDDRNETLTNAHTFAGIAGSDFIVSTTRL